MFDLEVNALKGAISIYEEVVSFKFEGNTLNIVQEIDGDTYKNKINEVVSFKTV
jgi:hypothetical protein